MSSIRQRSRSGDASPVCLSQHDIVAASSSVASAAISNAVATLARCSSDSNIKHKGLSDIVSLMLLILIFHQSIMIVKNFER